MDLYAKCPCGSGKKIKFCCKDIISDIERIERMLQGDQRTAALEKIDKLLEKHPNRPALLSLKAQVFIELRNFDEAKTTIASLLEQEPENPSALAMQALVTSVEGDSREALRLLHKSLRCSDGVLSQMVYRAYVSICFHLIQREEFISAYAHLLTLVSITQGQDRNSISMLMNLTSSERLPAIFQGLLIRDEAPENVSWKREFDVAIEMYRHGDWSEAAVLLDNMSNRILDEPVILRNQAILQAWTCQTEKASKSFRYFAAIRGIPVDDAVEAEACAEVLDPSDEADTVEMVSIIREIDDAQGLMEKLLSEDSVDSLPVQHNPDSETPPPKGQFLLFDRPIPPTPEEPDADVKLADAPREVCSITLFGKETDRNARFHVVGFRDEKWNDAVQRVSEVTGETIPADAEAEVITRMHKVERMFRPAFKVSPRTPLETLNQLQQQWVVERIDSEWPEIPLTQFDGKTATEAAKDKKLQRRVLAAILNLEIWSDRQPFEYDFDAMRSRLGLPVPEPIDPADVSIRSLSPTQLRRLQLEKLSAEDLKFVFEVVSVRPNGSLLLSICREILRRDDLGDAIDVIEVHERMADLAPTSDEQLEHLATARDLAVAKGESPASWLVAELDLRIQRGEADVSKRLINEIQSRYMREPGVAQMFASVLAKYGLMPAGAMPPGPLPGGPPAPMPAPGGPMPGPAAAPTAAAAPPPSGVWTPDAPTEPAPSGEGGESKLWVPGMD